MFSAERVRRQEKGIEGDIGEKGEPGSPGLTGPIGPKGDKGERAEKGMKGDIGLPGETGETGPRGAPGVQGDPGNFGSRGIPGDPGPRGAFGDKGDPGEKGARGIVGPQGSRGGKGDRGEKGDFGSRGLPGMEGLKGDEGEQGSKGSKGGNGDPGPPGLGGNFSSSGSGALYTRWGRTVCGGPLGEKGDPALGTELVYSGIAGSSDVGTNFMCMPHNPDYSSNSSRGSNDLNGAKYFNHPSGRDGLYVPCAVCHVTTRSTVMMIPAKSSCPPSWTMEYRGYLMGNTISMSQHECIDQDPEAVSDDNGGRRGRHDFFSIKVDCGNGLTCPPYKEDTLSCVVCSR